MLQLDQYGQVIGIAHDIAGILEGSQQLQGFGEVAENAWAVSPFEAVG